MTPQPLITIPLQQIDIHTLSSVDMWRPSFRQDTSSDVFQQKSPYLDASSGLLTPPSACSIDARRHSTASTLSLHGPTTPVYGRSPFSEHSHGVSIVDDDQEGSMEALAAGYAYRTPGSSQSSFDSWSALAHPDCSMSMRAHDSFGADSGMLRTHMATFSGVDGPTSSMALSFASTSFDSLPYLDFRGDQLNGSDDVADNERNQPIWPYPCTMEQMIAPATMAPSLLGGGFVNIHASDNDADMSPYDPFVRSPQEVTFRQDDRSVSEDERRIKRSIHVSSTGGKTVKKEQNRGGRVSKPRKSSKHVDKGRVRSIHIDMNDAHGIGIDMNDLHGIERDQGTGKLRRKGSSPGDRFCCTKLNKSGKPCQSSFRHAEHLARHEKSTHLPHRPYWCQLCTKKFDRNDNYWAHTFTHVRRPVEKHARNERWSLQYVLSHFSDPKHIAHLHNKWFAEVKCVYDPETDPAVKDDPKTKKVIPLKDRSPSPVDVREEDIIHCEM